MADRIETYLERLEAELEGRVSAERLETVLVEVEGHLRESEEGWRDLGEPDVLADRLALEGFGEFETMDKRMDQKSRMAGCALLSGLGWLIMVGLFAVPRQVEVGDWNLGLFAFGGLSLLFGLAAMEKWKQMLGGQVMAICLALLIGMSFFGGSWKSYQSRLVVQPIAWGEADLRADGRPMSAVLAELEIRRGERVVADSAIAAVIDHRIMKLEKAVASTREIQASRWVDRFAPVGYVVGLYGFLGTGLFWVFALVGWVLRLSFDLGKRVVTGKKMVTR